MKRLVIFVSVIAAFFLVISYIPKVLENSVQTSGAVKLSYDLYADTVFGTGQIENRGEYKLTSPVPLILSEFFVSEGEYVNSGDAVAKVDTDATKNYLYSLIGGSYASFLTADNIALVSNNIPEKLYCEKSGIVAEIDANIGEAVGANCPVLRIIDNDELTATVCVNEADAQNIKIGQNATMTCKAITTRQYLCTVENISNTARKKYNGTSAETVIDVFLKLNDTTLLKSGYTISADIMTSDNEIIAYIPYEVILQDDKGEFVYILKNGKALRQDIVTGRDLPKGEEVLEGLNENDIILTDKNLNLSQNVRVKYGLNKNRN